MYRKDNPTCYTEELCLITLIHRERKRRREGQGEGGKGKKERVSD